ncbi:MAG: hypothetical protein IJR93_12620 [Treponema sp.]|nr:hypothetical protein [Treponema sp.]
MTQAEELEKRAADFTAAFDSLKKAAGGDADKLKREARLLNIRYRLTLDLRISIETKYSSTKSDEVRETYERLFKFLNLWNVYEICTSYGEVLGMFKEKDWSEALLQESGTKEFLSAQEAEFKTQLLGSEKDMQEYREYLSHFANLPAIRKGNQEQYKTYLAQDADAFDYKQLLFIQYMERNAYYHGGEATHAGVNYSYRKRQLAFYAGFLTQFIALLGTRLFAMETETVSRAE